VENTTKDNNKIQALDIVENYESSKGVDVQTFIYNTVVGDENSEPVIIEASILKDLMAMACTMDLRAYCNHLIESIRGARSLGVIDGKVELDNILSAAMVKMRFQQDFKDWVNPVPRVIPKINVKAKMKSNV